MLTPDKNNKTEANLFSVHLRLKRTKNKIKTDVIS